MWGLGVWSQACGGLFELGLGSQPTLLPLQLGLHLCLVGWLANGSAAHPVVFPAADCGDGQVGVVSLGARENLSERWDAYCFRMRGTAAPPAHALLPLSADPLTHCTAFPADVACRCRDGFVGDGTSVCNGKLLDVLATTANFSTFYGVPRGQGCGAAGILGEGTHRESTHNPVSHHPQMLLGYANATPRGLDFLDFLDDERTYKTLFVPVNEGFVDNMVTGSVGRAGPDPAF